MRVLHLPFPNWFYPRFLALMLSGCIGLADTPNQEQVVAGPPLTTRNAPTPWNETPGTVELEIPSNFDGHPQKAIWRPIEDTSQARPLLVGLHTWSGDYTQSEGYKYLMKAVEKKWHFIHPDFRGVNRTPQATCSDLVVSDILDAVDTAKSLANVDPKRIYLVGVSGGGMASLMMAAKAPDVWAGVSSWAPISNLSDWHAETKQRKLKYTAMIEHSCGGAPGDSTSVDFQFWNRSPVHFLQHAAQVPLDINTGINDGHNGSVPVGHTLRAFNVLARSDRRISEEHIQWIEKKAQLPDTLSQDSISDPAYGDKTPLFRRQSGNTRVTLFEGGHEIVIDAAIQWLSLQRRP